MFIVSVSQKLTNGFNKQKDSDMLEGEALVELLGDRAPWVSALLHILLGMAGLQGPGHSFT